MGRDNQNQGKINEIETNRQTQYKEPMKPIIGSLDKSILLADF